MKNQKGFTLIEIMVVIIILGLLAGLVLPKFLGQEEKAKVEVAKTQIRPWRAHWTRTSSTTDFIPTTDQGLDALIKKPEVGRIPEQVARRRLSQARAHPEGPLGQGLCLILRPGSENREYEIISYGADDEPGGEGNNADIESWKMQ